MPTSSVTMEEQAFAEAAELLNGKLISPLNGVYTIGRYCAASIHLVLTASKEFLLTVSLSAFHPELVNWQKVTLSLGDDVVTLTPDSKGVTSTVLTPGTYELHLKLPNTPVPWPIPPEAVVPIPITAKTKTHPRRRWAEIPPTEMAAAERTGSLQTEPGEFRQQFPELKLEAIVTLADNGEPMITFTTEDSDLESIKFAFHELATGQDKDEGTATFETFQEGKAVTIWKDQVILKRPCDLRILAHVRRKQD